MWGCTFFKSIRTNMVDSDTFCERLKHDRWNFFPRNGNVEPYSRAHFYLVFAGASSITSNAHCFKLPYSIFIILLVFKFIILTHYVGVYLSAPHCSSKITFIQSSHLSNILKYSIIHYSMQQNIRIFFSLSFPFPYIRTTLHCLFCSLIIY